MSKMAKIPRLRFPEFSGEWVELPLEDMVSIVSGISPSNYSLNADSGLPFVKVEDLNNCSKYQLTAREYSASSKNMIRSGSIIFPKRGAAILLNKIRIAQCDILMDSNMMALTVKSQNFNNEFLYYKISDENLSKIADTSSIPQINNKHILPYRIFVPSVREQQKIANFLSAVDAKIEALSKKQELMERYKKGVMQKIFSQEIRFRADDGSEFPEWEEKRLGEVFERVTRKNKENNQNVLTISAQQGLVNQEQYFNKSVSAKDVSNYYLLQKGEFAYNKSYSNGYPMGAIKRLKTYDKGVVSTLYICFSIKSNDDVNFYEHYFDGGFLNREIQQIAQEGARNHGLLNVSVSEFFENIYFFLPSALEEQTKIANFLSSIDGKIEALSAELVAAKKFKKALLQQMFV